MKNILTLAVIAMMLPVTVHGKNPGGRRVVVTGGSGHFGKLIVQQLLSDPTVGSVVSLDQVPSGLKHQKLEEYAADVRDPKIEAYFEGADTVFHLAFLITSHLPEDRYESINIEGSKNVFEAAARAHVSQIIYASSIAAYGLVYDHPNPITEDTPLIHQPGFSYNNSKWRVENFLRTEFKPKHPEITVTVMRVASVLGLGQKSAIGSLLAKGVIPSADDVPWNIVEEGDVTAAFLLAFRLRAGGAFIISSDNALSARELAKASGMRHLHVPKWLGVSLARLSVLAYKLGLADAIDWHWFEYSDAPLHLSNERAKEVLGWKLRFPTARDVILHVQHAKAIRENTCRNLLL